MTIQPTNKHQIPPKSLQQYLRGPIGWDWLKTAMALPGSTLEVGLALWHYRALNKSLTFKKGVGDIAKFLELSKDTVRRALRSLEDAQLITLIFRINVDSALLKMAHWFYPIF